MEENMQNLKESGDVIAKNTVAILERVDNIENNLSTFKNEFDDFKLETTTHFNDLHTELKSFKLDTNEIFDTLNEKVDDVSDTVMLHDKRIEILESKALA